MTRRPLRIRVLEGLTSYSGADALQRDLASQRARGLAPDTLLLLEHAPVITLGRHADPRGVTADPEDLDRLGVEVRRTERGGQVTYHGPGQIVGYPIANLHDLRLGVAAYVRGLEEAMILSARRLGVEAHRREGTVGVFCDLGKIGAVGVRISRGITSHGFALNVDPDLSSYRLIVPCGSTDTPISSISAAHGSTPTMDEARIAIARSFAEAFGYETIIPNDSEQSLSLTRLIV